MKSFKEWLKIIESTTSASVAGNSGATLTSDIAVFKRPITTLVRRKWPKETKKS